MKKVWYQCNLWDWKQKLNEKKFMKIFNKSMWIICIRMYFNLKTELIIYFVKKWFCKKGIPLFKKNTIDNFYYTHTIIFRSHNSSYLFLY